MHRRMRPATPLSRSPLPTRGTVYRRLSRHRCHCRLSNDIWRRTCLRPCTDGAADPLVSFSVYQTCRRPATEKLLSPRRILVSRTIQVWMSADRSRCRPVFETSWRNVLSVKNWPLKEKLKAVHSYSSRIRSSYSFLWVVCVLSASVLSNWQSTTMIFCIWGCLLQKSHQLPERFVVAECEWFVCEQRTFVSVHSETWRSCLAWSRHCTLGPGYCKY